MKRVLLVLLGITAVAGLCPAQQNFNQRGVATQELQAGADQLYAAHPSLPIGSRARITNEATGDFVDVTITRRIQPSVDRVIDLSAAAAAAINLSSGGNISIVAPPPADEPVPVAQAPEPTPVAPEPAPAVVAQTPEPTPAAPEPAPAVVAQTPEPTPAAPEPAPAVVAQTPEPTPVAPEPAPAVVAQTPEPTPSPVETVAPPPNVVAQPAGPATPMRITIHNYVVTPDDPSAGANVSTYTTGNMPPLTEVSSPAPQLPAITTGVPQPSAWGPAAEVVVIPGLPDPLSGKVYRLQVGSYSSSESAAGIMKILETAGFVPVNEPHANLVRVLVTGIQAASVQSAIQRLGSIGFTQIWVRE